jgi:starch synthase
MRVLLASSEVYPYSKTGGLADMVGALAKFLAKAGCQVDMVTPLYRGIRERFPELRRLDWNLDLPMGQVVRSGGIYLHQPVAGLSVYFIDQPHLFDRSGLYQEHGHDFSDNAERFIFFSKAAVNLACHLPSRPELVHVHDWQAGLVPLLLQEQCRRERWVGSPKCCLTIHNLAYQGQYSSHAYALTNLPGSYFSVNGVEFYGGMNCLKAGILFSQALTTVSPRYAREITRPELGFGLDGVLRNRQSVLFGILNGVDYSEWDPRRNSNLTHPYDAQDLSGKIAQKAELQSELKLPVDPRVPLFGNIGRLVHQKGVDIMVGALEELLPAGGLQFVSLGAGLTEFETALQNLARRYPSQVAVRTGYDHGLPHRIEAGCDFFLMPSQFEPCGLNQMYSLRYGTIPIVRATGGLDDSVIDIRESPALADGIKFDEYSVPALAKAIRKGLVLYQQPDLLLHYRLNGMVQDFSWDRTAAQYIKVYERTLASSLGGEPV